MIRAAAVGISLGLLLGACGSEPDGSRRHTLTVFAAASLKAPFTEIGRQFEAQHDGVTVTFSFAGSSDLVAQLQQGAPADVLATADTVSMTTATGDDLVAGMPRAFATNTLQIVTPPDNPAGVDSIDDLAAPGVAVVVCAAQVPCGSAARLVETASGVGIRPVSEEQSVTDVLGKVVSGEADAGLVYVTDVLAAGDTVRGVVLPESVNTVNTYPLAALRSSVDSSLASEFVSFVTGSQGRDVLAAAGFGRP